MLDFARRGLFGNFLLPKNMEWFCRVSSELPQLLNPVGLLFGCFASLELVLFLLRAVEAGESALQKSGGGSESQPCQVPYWLPPSQPALVAILAPV